MKEKPQKPGKASKKGKAPETPVELTPKQLKEKKREEARARAAESRKIVTAGTGQWTGKLPAQLLNEHAQKMKWERVDYPTKSFGREPDQKWVASVVLARRNPKTKEIERVRFDPPADRVEKQPTQLEARHMAATYGMHRVLSHRNMKMMLPPLHRDLWAQFDEDKAKAKPHEMYKWSEDPWQAEIDRRESRRKFEEEQRAREQKREQNEIAREAQRSVQDEAKINGDMAKEARHHKGEPQQSDLKSLKRIKFNNTLVMSRKARSVVESVIRDQDGFRFSTKDALHEPENPERYAKLITMLTKLGFRENYAKEALEYSSSLSTALSWLLIHVPEDDVPPSFMPTDIGATARVSASIKIENCTSRLREFGYSEDIARSVANKFDGSLAESVINLSGIFADYASNEVEQKEEENDIWTEELESLSSLLDEEQIYISDNGLSCKLKSNNVPIQITFFKPQNYPHRIPGIAIEATNLGKISKLTQLEITRQAVVYAKNQLAGDYMLILLFQHIEEIFDSIISNPPKLAQVSSGISGIDEIHRFKAINEHKQLRSKAASKTVNKFDAKRVLQERDNRMNSQPGKEMLDNRAKLPAWTKREEIVKLVETHQVVLITGETGSGKSTQAVQFILDSIPDAQILCTQPRRISAIGVAQRVAEERLVAIGDQVGYIIRGEAKMSKKTQLRFVTSGVLLRMLQSEAGANNDDYTDIEDGIDAANDIETLAGLQGITHIFVDEVHERSLDGDFLLILLKRLITKAPKIKIVLMSATVDPEQFFNYFKPVKVGYTHIKGRTFPVNQYYLGDVITVTGYRPNIGSHQDLDSNNSHNYDENEEDNSVGKIIGEIRKRSPGRVDYNLVAATVEHIHHRLLKQGDTNGSILIFLSGAGEIDEALRAIKRTESSSSLWALPLHASLPPVEQRKVFQKAPRSLRKVVASTNVAETSITISDIVAVIDTGRVKETVYDVEVNVSRLVDTWTSQSSATQRMGRAGRVRAGECFKLYSQNTEQTRMPLRPLPEILRSPLEVLYLNVKAMGISNVEKFLSLAIDPPKQVALDKAKMNLMAYGALDAYNNLTSLGKHISMIPTDPKTAKLLVLGTMMGCLSSCLTVASVLSLGKLPFVVKRNEDSFNRGIFQEFSGSSGDLIAACKAYEGWRTNTVDKTTINQGVCRDIRSTRKQLLSSLVQIGFIDSNTISGNSETLPPSLSKYDNEEASVRAVVSASLQPNTAEVVFPQQKYVSTSGGAIQKDGVDDARQIKYFKNTGERVFVHPRSLMFGATDFIDGARYVSYGSAILTSKHFIAEVTPLSTYGLILFSGRIDVDPLGNGIIVDKWTGLKCWPRAGILLQFLQQLFSILMERKFREPGLNFIDHPVIELVHDLIESDGRAQPVGLVA